MSGFAIAFGEITLVLFTTLAPSGAVAYLIMGLPVLFGRADGAAARCLNKLTCLPLVVTMVGLVASATHLGNPSNALYVFTGVGRSPLSTEVVCAVIFLALAGVYWLYSFAETPRRWLQRAMLLAIDGAIVAFVTAVAWAYDVGTIITWSLPLVPVALLLNSLAGGPIIALLGFALARFPVGRGAAVLTGVSAAALVANTAVYVVLGVELAPLANELASVAQLVPVYPAWVSSFAVLGAAGIAVAWRACRAAGRPAGGRPATTAASEALSDTKASKAPRRTVILLAAATALVLAGIFAMRFVFYMTHLTVGLGV